MLLWFKKCFHFFSVQMANVLTEGNQLEKVLSPSEEVDCPPVLDDTSAPLNFSGLTPCQFGISAQSFTPASLSNRKGETTALLRLHSLP